VQRLATSLTTSRGGKDEEENFMIHYDYIINGKQQEGARLYQLTIKDSKRHSAAAAFRG
jgi:choline dehydrogenase